MSNLAVLKFQDPSDQMSNATLVVNSESTFIIPLKNQQLINNLHGQLIDAIDDDLQSSLTVEVAGHQYTLDYNGWTAALCVFDDWLGMVM